MVPRKMMAWSLGKQRMSKRLIKLVVVLYEKSKTKVKTSSGVSDELFRVELHLGLPLSPIFFILII